MQNKFVTHETAIASLQTTEIRQKNTLQSALAALQASITAEEQKQTVGSGGQSAASTGSSKPA